tara:strand:+ start:17 stop:421 length:405 start_codon:yes stop_codon:yes gene_type:complete
MTPADAARLLAAYDAARYSTDSAPDRALASEAPALARLVADLDAEVQRLRADLADRDLALAMARGECWLEGWTKHPIASEWTSPDGRWCIGDATLKWSLWRHYQEGGEVFQDRLRTNHPDALSALRAYQAKVTP